MNRHTCAVWLLVWVSIGIGCGDDRSRGGGSGGPVAVEDLPGRVADATCTTFERCLGTFGDLTIFGGGDCRTEQTRTLEDSFVPQLNDAIERGTVEYDPNAVGACLNDLTGSSCDDLLQRTSEPCEDAIMGTVGAGEDCLDDFECAGADTYCNRGALQCPGTCAIRQSSGGSCDDDDHCADGLVCQRGSCAAPAALGETCGNGGSDCAPGLFCQGEDQGDGVCASIDTVFGRNVGEACNFEMSELCDLELSCALVGFDRENETITTECVARASSGGACPFAIPGACPSGEYCDVDIENLPTDGSVPMGTCRELPGEGEACHDGVAEPECQGGLYCRNGRCQARSRLGMSCSGGGDCYSGNCDNGTCATPDNDCP